MLEPMDNVLNIKKFLFSLISKFIIYLWLFIILTGISFAQETKPIIKIGILANNGIENCKKTWQPTINYLNISMPDHNFQLVPVLYFNTTQASLPDASLPSVSAADFKTEIFSGVCCGFR